MPKGNDWIEWRQHVLLELKRLNTQQAHLNDEMIGIRIDLTKLKTKASMWGAAAGVVVSIVAGIIIKVI